MAPTTGFVLHVSMDLLQKQAEKHDTGLHLHVLPGAFVEEGRSICSCDAPLDDASRKAIADAVSIGPGRTFDHDPRFGLIVMGEIAARSLSAAINDPGTCADVMATAVKVLGYWSRQKRERDAGGRAAVEFDRVSAPAIREAGMVEDVFAPIARYGAPAVDVGITLQLALKSLQRLDGDIPAAALALSHYALQRASHAGLPEVDLEQLRSASETGRKTL